MNNSMKHTITKVVLGILVVAFLSYLAWLFSAESVLVRPYHIGYNMLAYLILGGIAVYFGYAVFQDSILPNNRRWLALLGIILIVFAQIYLVDTPNQYIFTSDVTKIFGVFLLIVWPTKMLLSSKSIEKREMKNVEIIEV